MLVVTRSPVGTCSTNAPSGAITEIQPEIRVATQTLPEASTASEFEHLVAAEARDRFAALAAIDHVTRPDRARRRQIEGPQPRGRRFRDIDRVFIRRQSDAVGRQHAEYAFDDLPGARLDVIERTDIHVAGATLAEIGEPETAVPVEHQIVRALQRVLAAFVEHGFDLAGRKIDALDRAADIFMRLGAPGISVPREGIQLKPPLLQI